MVVSVKQSKEDEFLDIITKHDVEFSSIGVVTSSLLYVDKVRWGNIGEWRDLYDNALERALGE